MICKEAEDGRPVATGIGHPDRSDGTSDANGLFGTDLRETHLGPAAYACRINRPDT